jgi:hypothetical protein
MTPVMTEASEATLSSPADSRVASMQLRLLKATRDALQAVADDVEQGLLETVGVRSRMVEGERASMAIELPPGTDRAIIARAIDLENVEAWLGEDGQVNIAIGPWYSTKDVDQVVLTTTKVVHVLLGLHAVCTLPRPENLTLAGRLLHSVAEVLTVLKPSEGR